MAFKSPELTFRPTIEGKLRPATEPQTRRSSATHIALDRYIVDSLMPDLVGHDRQPSAFIVFLYLWCRAAGRRDKRAAASLQQMALETGLSKSAVQQAVRTLKRRGLVHSHQASATSVPQYTLSQPWRRR